MKNMTKKQLQDKIEEAIECIESCARDSEKTAKYENNTYSRGLAKGYRNVADLLKQILEGRL